MKQSYYNSLRSKLTNMDTMELLDALNIRHFKSYPQNLKILSDYLTNNYKGTIKNFSKRYLTALLDPSNSKYKILDPATILAQNNIPVPATMKERTQQIANIVNATTPTETAKVIKMINSEQNRELLDAVTEKLNYEPITDKDIIYTDKNGNKIGYLGQKEIIIKEPQDVNNYLECKINAEQDANRYAFHEKEGPSGQLIDGEPYAIYYSNAISNIDDIFTFLYSVYQKERKPFKLHFSFGCVYEEFGQIPEVTTDKNGETKVVYKDGWKYNFVNANPNIVKRSIPAVINNEETLALYRQYIINTIEEAKDAIYISTKHHWISIVNIMFAVYRMMPVQGKLSFIPDELLRNRTLVSYNEDNNLCFWAAYAAYIRFINNDYKLVRGGTKAKDRGLTIASLTTDAKKLLKSWCEYKKETFDCKTYNGFNFTDMEEFVQWAKVNVCVYDYDESCKSFTLFSSFTLREEKPINELPFNFLLLTHEGKNHIMFIKDPEFLCGILICPKCHKYCYNKKIPGSKRSRFDNHVEKCTGKVEKHLRLDTVAHPYCPHLWKTPYATLLSVKEAEYWQPTRYYMTFDFETMEEKMEKLVTDKTTVQSKIVPLSVALTVYSKKGLQTYWFSRKDKSEMEFILSFIRCMFTHYDEVYESNTIVTPTRKIVPKHVTVLGYNSGKFDLNLLLPYLNDPINNFKIVDLLGTTSNFKALKVAKGKKLLNFVDAMHYVTPQPLRDFVHNFGSEKCPQKGYFPYQSFDSSNFKEVLSKSEPFEKKDFFSDLTGQGITDEEYELYLEDTKNFDTRWDYLEYYNRLDTISMISPLNNLIERTAQYKVDMLSNLSLSANSSNTKYALAYKDFDPYANYATNQVTTFQITKQWWKNKVKQYMEQDKAKGRDVSQNVTIDDFAYFKEKFATETCYLCHEGFTNENAPTLDRIDNSKGHSKDNVKICCKYCNIMKSDRSEDEARIYVNLKKYCRLHNLPMTITNEDVYHLLRKGITGGMSNVLHRLNIKGQTPINHLVYEDDRIKSINSKYKVTHVTGIDFNSLYPSVYSSIEHPFIPYTDHKMYMPGSVLQAFKCSDIFLKQRARYIIKCKEELFVADVKGYIPEEYWNEFINLPPIWRNIKINSDKETLGPYMYNYMKENKLTVDTKTKKLTMLMSTHPECAVDDENDGYMTFSSYYLWFLIDRCHFVIEDVRYIVTFTKHTGFNSFVNIFMNNRQEAIAENNKGLEMFCKISLNGSYGYDGMNTEKFTKSKILDKNKTYKSQLNNSFLSTRKISEDSYIVERESKSFPCNTCIQEAFFTLDNAKYWYLNFVYNFMHKAFDMERIHFVEGDTDSMYWAISGDPNKDCHQGFEAVIKDQKFYNENAKYFFPIVSENMTPLEKIRQEKKLLGLSIEKEGDNCIALASKCYTVWDNPKDETYLCDNPKDETYLCDNHEGNTKALKVKGIKKEQSNITYQDYIDVLTNNSVKTSTNVNLQLQDGVMSKISVYKNALTCAHTKMRVFKNQSCCPFL